MNTSVSIREMATSDFEQAASWLSNADINRWLTGEWRDREVSAITLAIAVRSPRNRLFVVCYDKEPCGVVALADIEEADSTAMIWYILGEQRLRRRGITSEAVRQLTDFAFEEGLRSVYAWTMADNVGSQRVLRHAGFEEAGVIRNAANSAGEVVDRVYFDKVCEVQ